MAAARLRTVEPIAGRALGTGFTTAGLIIGAWETVDG
jgi:hypothetical protein